MRCSLYLRRCMAALVLVMALAPLQANAQPAQEPIITPGFQHLIESAPDIVGSPVESEHPGDNPDSTVVRTTTGLLYWEPGLLPSWTNGHDRATVEEDNQITRWVGELLKPPLDLLVSFLGGGPNQTVSAQVYCIESKESGGANVANRHGSGASGVMQYMPGTFYAHAAEMGHYDWSPWVPWQARAVAEHDLQMGRRAQWTVGGC